MLILSYIVLVLGILAFIGVTGYLDVNSTEAALKRGTGHEANPVMAALIGWAQTHGGWIWYKIALATFAAGALTYSLSAFVSIGFIGMILLVISFAYYVFIVARNYEVAGTK